MDNFISDNDPIYEKLDRLYDEDKFDEIIAAVKAVPRKHWSNKLWFRIIGAYNNTGKFGEAVQELQGIFPRCRSHEDLARYWYQRGYILYKTDHELAAQHLYERGLLADPDDSLDLKAEISGDLQKLANISERAMMALKKHCASTMGKIKYRLSDEEFALRLAYLPSIRHIPNTKYGLGFDNFLKKFPDDEKRIVRAFLKNNFGIIDKKSLDELLNGKLSYNLTSVMHNVCAQAAGSPDFDVSALDQNGKELFGDFTLFLSYIIKFLPTRGGVTAWDISEKIGFTRNAYACDIITEKDYREAVSIYTDLAKRCFSDFDEYLTSLVLGSGMFMFLEDNRSVKSAIKYIDTVMPLVLEGDVPDIIWNR